jgi:hypothetical protein
MKLRRVVSLVGLFVVSAPSNQADAQLRPHGVYRDGVAIPAYDGESHVYREHIEVLLPPTYLRVKRPNPATVGYFAWKFSFGTDQPLTVVFRADTALRVNEDRAILRASRLYLCDSVEQWVLDCTRPISGRAYLSRGGVVIEIREPSLISTIRDRAPTTLVRQLFEPGGRFRVDETGIKYH